MSSVFETLLDEILMIIIRYSGDVCTIFRTFQGLNQRLNNILVDHRFHLFADFLLIDAHDEMIHCYYNSTVFQNVSQQLSSMQTTVNAKQLRQCLDLLIAFHVRETYTRLERQLQLHMGNIQSIRKHLSNDVIFDLDDEVKAAFDNLHNKSSTISSMKRIESVVLTKGTRLECDEYEMGTFALATAVNELLLYHFNHVQPETRLFVDSMIEMFKALISSNPHLLNDTYYSSNGGDTVYYYLFSLLYPVY
ncbi:unnamed protein product [Rotaria sp. Silwood2]|nr:unnamed protein product [Rotaria sp. Silwood2]CAF4251719.1 unnamed protein product [Rotaria sp. Silwood2]